MLPRNARLGALLIGLIIVALICVFWVVPWLPYADEVPFWYMTSYSIANLTIAMGVCWVIAALVLWPLTSPSSTREATLAFVAYSVMGVGYSFIAPTRFTMFGFAGFNPLLGYMIILVGVVFLAFAYMLSYRSKMRTKPPS